MPSQFSWTSENKYARQRTERLMRRRVQASQQVSATSECSDIASEVVVEPVPPMVVNYQPDDTLATDTVTSDAWSQTDVDVPFDITKFMFDDEAIRYYTGLENYSKVMFVLATLGHAAYNLSYYYYAHTCENLSVPNQFFLVLIKLRVHMPNFQLSRMFAISENSVSNIFITWINFMALQWREIGIMPSREMTSFHMPDDYVKKFPRTRVIIDGMECPIMKPKNPRAQQATFSSYKNRNTLKVLVGSSPGGVINLVSPAYGGSVSDRQLTERINLGKACDPGDQIMADKGFNIQDIVGLDDVHVNMPTFLRKGNQFHPKVLARDRQIASKRVHIERHIGLIKTYKILCQPMNLNEASLGSEIIFVCSMLCNFRSCIIRQTA